MMKKLIAIVVAFFAAVPLMADTQSDWYASLSDKREPSTIYVGNERWRSWDTDKPLPYRFACGAILNSTAGGKRLDLTNVSVLNGSIQADGDLAILLYGDNYVSDGIFVNSGNTYYPLLIFGPGALTVRGAGGSGIMCGDLSICAGPFVTVIGGGISAGKTLVSMSSVAIHSPGSGLRGSNINILGAAVAIYSGTGSGSGVGMGGITTDNIVIDGSVVSIVDDGGWRGVWAQTLSVSHSAFSCVIYSDGWGCICADHAYFDNSIAKLYSKVSEPFNNSYVGDVTFGEGDYYIASGSQAYTIGANEVTIKGGNLQICSANAESSAMETEKFQMDAGRLEIVDKVDVREFLKYDAATAAAFTGALASGIDVTSLMANFYSQVILDAISNAKIGNLNGVPNVGIDCSGSFDTYIQNGGTVWCDLPKYGIMCHKPVVNGGSYKGQFYNPSYSYTVSGGHDLVSPVNSSGNALKCVSYAVAGAKKYDKITQSWSGILPAYYGTGSLYADAAGKLYFWVPESWNVPGGGSGGGGSGGGGDTPSSTQYWTINFNANGGSGTEATRSVANGTVIGTLPVPTRDGYVFAGWFTAVIGGTMISEAMKITADVTLYAHWIVNGGGSDGGAVDLAFYVPEHQGWTAALIVSADPFATATQKVFEPGEPICLNYAFKNVGNGLAVSNFVNRFTLSNGYYWEHSWIGYSVPENGWGWLGYNFAPAFLNGLPPGDYTLTCALNVTEALPESNTANNTATVSFKVKGPDLVVPFLSVSKETITVSESVVVNWRVANTGSGGAGKTKTSFLTYGYNSSTRDLTLRKTELSDCDPLAAGGSREYTKTITGKALGVGEHNISVWADSKSDIAESTETNNWKFVYVKVVNDAATSSKVGIDWQFKKLNTSDPDTFYLSADSSLNKKATVFNVGQPIYMRRAFWNAKKRAVDGKVTSAYWLNGVSVETSTEESYISANTILYNMSTYQSFLQDLPAGSYTLTAVIDSDDHYWETDEKNNVKTISFTVVGMPKIFCETSYTCALNEPVSWPVTIDGKATVKGLPSGLKYSGGAITGKATKVGTYTVNISTKNEAGTATRSITIRVEDPGFTVSCSARPNGSSADGNVASGGTVEMFVGVNQAIMLSSVPGKAGVANSDASVTAKGLPAGLKLSGGTITGVPTKAGTFAVTVSFKNKLSWTASFMLNIVVRPLPEWAQGTFTGVDVDYAIQEYGSATLSVASAGKVSGKVALCGTNWTFSAASYDSAVLYESGEPAEFRIKADMKAGKAVIPVELAVFAIDPPKTDETPLQNARVYGKLAEDAELILWRTLWKDKTTAAEVKRVLGGYEGVYTMSLDADDVGSGYLSLTVGKDGNVKASGKLADGTSASTTSPLMYDDAANGYFVYLYAAPSAYKGGSFALTAGLVPGDAAVAGRPPYRLVPVAFTPLWTSHSPEATGEYGAGFVRGLGFTGAYYDKLGTLKKYYESLRVSLDGCAPELGFTYKETYFDEKGKKVTTSSVQTAEAIDTFSRSGMTVSVNEKGALVVEKATKPVQDRESKEWLYDGTNDGALTLSFAQATGIFKGSYTFWYDYVSAYDDTTGKETWAHTSKKVSFEGILVQGEEPKMEGFYLWDATGEYEDEKTGKLKSYKYKQSFPVRLLAQ